jgi:hypothetical protein
MSEEREYTVKFSASGAVSAAGRFEVDAITAGEGNGWKFSAECLRESLALWDGAACFVDHSFWGHSVRDLGGTFQNPKWNEESQGVRLELQAMGPAGKLIDELGRQILAEQGSKPRVGFSADILFTAKGREVIKILRVLSCDLVYNPARGGAFVRALNSVPEIANIVFANIRNSQFAHMGESNMENTEEVKIQTPPAEPGDVEAVRKLLQVQQEQARLAEEAEKAKAVRAQMCGYLLDSGLAAAKLPAAVESRIRKQYAGQVFEPAELVQAIDDARALVSELTGGMTVAGPGRVHGMYSSEDQLQAAVDDLLNAPREQAHATLNVHRLTGIRELYLMLTGDDDLHGGYHPSRVRLATTADFAGLVKNALNKIVANQWDELGRAGYDWWQRITLQEHFTSLQDITGTLVGTVGALPSVAEGAEYTELVIGDSPETASFTKYGGYVPLTLELIDRDETRKLRQYPRELANAGLRKISALVAAIFTTASGAGPTMADTGALFNNTAVTSAGGHANLLTVALAAAQWEVVQQAVYNQPMLIKNAVGVYGTGAKMAINPKFCLVPRALELTAKKILYPSWENAANIHSENLQKGAQGDVVVVPEWTDATDWAAVVDPRLAPGIIVGERFGMRPEIFVAGSEQSPAVFMNDEHRIKVRHFLAVLVQDFRPLHKSNVVG